MVTDNFMIETARLRLRRWTVEDADDLYRYASDGRVSEMALWPRHTSVDMSRHVIKEFFIPNEHNFAIADKATGEVIGCIGLVPSGDEHYDVAPGEREIGYWIGFSHWGKGLVTEALGALLEYCGKSLALRSVILTIDLHNKASQRVAEKCGFILIDQYSMTGVPTLAYRCTVD